MHNAEAQMTLRSDGDESRGEETPRSLWRPPASPPIIIPTRHAEVEEVAAVPNGTQAGPHPRQPAFARGLPSCAIGADCDIRLRVEVTGSPRARLSWQKDSAPIEPEGRDGFGCLWLRDRAPRDAGVDACAARTCARHAVTSPAGGVERETSERKRPGCGPRVDPASLWRCPRDSALRRSREVPVGIEHRAAGGSACQAGGRAGRCVAVVKSRFARWGSRWGSCGVEVWREGSRCSSPIAEATLGSLVRARAVLPARSHEPPSHNSSGKGKTEAGLGDARHRVNSESCEIAQTLEAPSLARGDSTPDESPSTQLAPACIGPAFTR
ncbi:unnamed protein product [Lampetra planeri]